MLAKMTKQAKSISTAFSKKYNFIWEVTYMYISASVGRAAFIIKNAQQTCIVFVTCVTQPALVATAAAVTTVAVQLVDTVAVHTRIRSTLVDICAKIIYIIWL